MRSLEEAEEDEIVQRSKIARETEDEVRLSTCFVEFLNEHHFFNSLFAGDESAKLLLTTDAADLLLKELVFLYTLI